MDNLKEKQRHFLLPALAVLALILVACGAKADPAAQLQEKLDLGERYLTDLDYDSAIAAFEEALEIDPKDEQALQGLGDAYRGRANEAARSAEAGSAESAREDYEQARSYYAELPASSERAAEVQEDIEKLDVLIESESRKPVNWAEAFEWELVKLGEWDDRDGKRLEEGEYSLILLNDDEVPELFIWIPYEEGQPAHFLLLVYDPETGNVRADRYPSGENDNLEMFGYMEGTGRFYMSLSTVDSGSFSSRQEIHVLSDDTLEPALLADIKEEMIPETEEIGGEQSTSFYSTGNYLWNGEIITREEYRKRRDELVNWAVMITFSSDHSGNMETMDYRSFLGTLQGFKSTGAFRKKISYRDAYLELIAGLEEQYGELRLEPNEYNDKLEEAKGLVLLLLEDMDENGVPELIAFTNERYTTRGEVYSIVGTKAARVSESSFNAEHMESDSKKSSIRLFHTRDHGLIFPSEFGDKQSYSMTYYGMKYHALSALFWYLRVEDYNKETDEVTMHYYVNDEEVDSAVGYVYHSELVEGMRDEWLGEYEEESYCVGGPKGSVDEELLREKIEQVKEELAAVE